MGKRQRTFQAASATRFRLTAQVALQATFSREVLGLRGGLGVSRHRSSDGEVGTGGTVTTCPAFSVLEVSVARQQRDSVRCVRTLLRGDAGRLELGLLIHDLIAARISSTSSSGLGSRLSRGGDS